MAIFKTVIHRQLHGFSLITLPRRRFLQSSVLRASNQASNQAPGAPQRDNVKPPKSKSPLKVWPFLLILVGGSLAFRELVISRSTKE
jgi:hypothetical protein